MKKVIFSFVAALFTLSLTFITTSCSIIEELNDIYTVTFDSKGGSKVDAQKVNLDELVTKPEDPTRDGHSFVGWAKADNESSPLWNFYTETVTSSITLYARWSVNTYKITFNSDGGDSVPSQTVSYGDVVEKPTDPTRTGYEFDGWFDGDTEWDFSTIVTASITLKAKWTQLHLVTFNANNGTETTSQTIRNGDMVEKPEDPTKVFSPTGLLFAGKVDPSSLSIPSQESFVEWRKEGENVAYNFSTPITAPITLKAVWNSPADPANAIDISSRPGVNRVEQAFNYINSEPGEYTLFIGQDVSIAPQTINVSNVRLTIIGLGGRREINFRSDAEALFSVGEAQCIGISLTIGNNITIKGGTGAYGRSNVVDVIQGAEFVMLDGSEISGHTMTNAGWNNKSAVRVTTGATFSMKGGEIKDNTAAKPTSYSISNPSGVYISGGTFNMEGGKITNNTNGDVFVSTLLPFTLSGSAEAGTVTIAAGSTANTSISIISGWTGKFNQLNLYGESTMATVIGWWVGKQVLTGTGINAANIAKFPLGFFHAGSSDTQAISPATGISYEINSTGLLVTK